MERIKQFLKNLLWQPQWIPLLIAMVIGYFIGIFEKDSSGQEIADHGSTSPDCDNCFVYFEPFPRVWPHEIEVVVNLENMPSWLNETKLEVALGNVFKKINAYAYVPFVYSGTTNAQLIEQYSEERRHTVLVAFDSISGLGRGWIWWNWHGEEEINYGEVTLDPDITESQFPGVLLHEFACHILYMDHSAVQNSICAGPPHTSYNSTQYQATLRRDDILAIQSLYPARPNLQGSITSFDGERVCFYQPEIEYQGIRAEEVESCSNINDVSAEIVVE